MAASAFIHLRVTQQMKLRLRALAQREGRTESALLEQLFGVMLRSVGMACSASPGGRRRSPPGATDCPLQPSDQVLLRDRARGASGHWPQHHQIAKVANEGGGFPGSVREELRAMLRICEALRENTKALLMANLRSWSVGHSEADAYFSLLGRLERRSLAYLRNNLETAQRNNLETA
jgi:hypothetical protein